MKYDINELSKYSRFVIKATSARCGFLFQFSEDSSKLLRGMPIIGSNRDMTYLRSIFRELGEFSQRVIEKKVFYAETRLRTNSSTVCISFTEEHACLCLVYPRLSERDIEGQIEGLAQAFLVSREMIEVM